MISAESTVVYAAVLTVAALAHTNNFLCLLVTGAARMRRRAGRLMLITEEA